MVSDLMNCNLVLIGVRVRMMTTFKVRTVIHRDEIWTKAATSIRVSENNNAGER